MVAMLIALLFSAAFVASVWSIWITVAPRLNYMRALLSADVAQGVAPAPVRARISARPVARALPARALRAVA